MATKIERQIAHDLALCDAGLALTSGKLRRRYAAHRRACFRALAELNKADGLDALSTDELLAQLTDPPARSEG